MNEYLGSSIPDKSKFWSERFLKWMVVSKWAVGDDGEPLAAVLTVKFSSHNKGYSRFFKFCQRNMLKHVKASAT